MNNPFLVGENIYLRSLEETDLDGNYVNWLNDDQVCKYNSHHVFPYTFCQAKEYINNILSSKNDLVLAIVLKENDKHVGNISLQGIDYLSRNAEFAILLGDKNYWGKGIAKQASLLIMNHGFIALNLHRIYCGTSSENIPMQKLAKFLCMTEEGIRKDALYKNGVFVDIIEYGVLKDDFFKKNKI